MTTVIHIKDRSSYDVYIGRPSKWGNPFIIGMDGDRAEVIKKYRNWIKNRKELLDSLSELKDKRLCCFCKPLACHGDVLVELINERLYGN